MKLGDRINEIMQEKGISRRELAEALNTTTATIGDLINHKTKNPRNLIDIATALGVDPIWLKTGQGNAMSLATIDNNEPRDGDIVIDVLNVEASAGHGALGDLVEVVTSLSYAPEQYYQMFHGLSPENTRVINLKGDSMTPTFNSGDMLFVDISVTYFDGDGIYVFNYKGQTYVKRLQHIGDALLVISDNKAYKEWQISEENQDQFHIQAKVKVHQSQKLNWLG